jgi:hypothetical protein
MHSGENLPPVDSVLGTMNFSVMKWAACFESLVDRVEANRIVLPASCGCLSMCRRRFASQISFTDPIPQLFLVLSKIGIQDRHA